LVRQNHGYTFASQGNAHEFGNGTVLTRTARYGFRGRVAENMAGNSDDARMAFNVEAVAGKLWALPQLGTWPSYDRCGFGMATNPRGERLWYAVYGTETKKAPDPAEAKGSDLAPRSHGTPPYAGNVVARFGILKSPAIVPQSCANGQCFAPRSYAQPQYQRRGLFGRGR
jgi:hypothetical protein